MIKEMKRLVTYNENETGQTGDFAPGKLIGIFWMLVVAYISFAYFGFVPGPVDGMSFTQWIGSSFIFGVLSAGFYWQKAREAFNSVVEALGDRIRGE